MGSPLLTLCIGIFLVEIDVGPIFCINLVHCVHMKAERPILAKQNTFKIDISIWQLLGLERTLLSCLISGWV